jgi:hypothetical protein
MLNCGSSVLRKRECTTIEALCQAARLEDARKRCQDFATRFYDTFPAELRHMVYEYIWDDQVFNKSTADTLIAIPRRYCSKITCTCFSDSELPVCVRRDFVGLDVAKEVVASYYGTFGMHLGCSFSAFFDDHLFEDHFHVGVLPVDHVRQVEIDVGSWDNWLHGTGAVCMEMFEYYHERLDKIRLKRGLQISLRSNWNRIIVFGYSKAKGLCNFFADLRESGAIVSLLVYHRYTSKKYDITDIFDMEIYEWEEKWRHILRDDLLPYAQHTQNHSSSDPVSWELVQACGFYL